jgi:predicted site-specific integrase-resolvase
MPEKVTITRCKGELVGAAEAAEILGVKVPQITRWRRAGKMPPPVEELRATYVWLRTDVEQMAASRRRP